MKNSLLLTMLCFALISACLGGTANAEGKKDQNKPDACFANPSFQGVCTVSPTKDETPEGILSYLNSSTSAGKSYCGNTKVRGGWNIVDCKTGKAVTPAKSSN